MRKRGRNFKRRIDPLAAFRSVDRQHPLDNGQKLQLGVVLRTHLEALRTGKADATAFHNLASGVNVSMVLAERGLEYIDRIGVHMTEGQAHKTSRKKLLEGYIASASLRTDWGKINKDAAIAHAEKQLARLGKQAVKV